jgi:hypothetical protein
MLGFECWADPSFLKSQNEHEQIQYLNDDGTSEVVDVKTLTECYHQQSDLFALLEDLDSGVVTFSFSEYQSLPAKLHDCRRLYRRLKLARKGKK